MVSKVFIWTLGLGGVVSATKDALTGAESDDDVCALLRKTFHTTVTVTVGPNGQAWGNPYGGGKPADAWALPSASGKAYGAAPAGAAASSSITKVAYGSGKWSGEAIVTAAGYYKQKYGDDDSGSWSNEENSAVVSKSWSYGGKSYDDEKEKAEPECSDDASSTASVLSNAYGYGASKPTALPTSRSSEHGYGHPYDKSAASSYGADSFYGDGEHSFSESKPAFSSTYNRNGPTWETFSSRTLSRAKSSSQSASASASSQSPIPLISISSSSNSGLLSSTTKISSSTVKSSSSFVSGIASSSSKAISTVSITSSPSSSVGVSSSSSSFSSSSAIVTSSSSSIATSSLLSTISSAPTSTISSTTSSFSSSSVSACIPVPSTNVLLNSGFGLGVLAPWTTSATDEVQSNDVVSGISQDGDNYAFGATIVFGGSVGAGIAGVTQTFTLLADAQVSCSAWAAISDESFVGRFQITIDGVFCAQLGYTGAAASTDFQEFTGTRDFAAGLHTVNVELVGTTGTSSEGTFSMYVDNISLVPTYDATSIPGSCPVT